MKKLKVPEKMESVLDEASLYLCDNGAACMTEELRGRRGW